MDNVHNCFLSLWGASCCVILYVYLSNIPVIATKNFYCYFYSVCSQRVSALTCYPQVKYNIIYI
jgi:hypothetical protein